MPDFIQQTGPDPGFERGHCPIDDVRVRAILAYTVALVGFTVVFSIGLAIYGAYVDREIKAARGERPALLNIEAGQFPGPGLQDNPARDRPERDLAEANRLDEYAWVEPEKTARIPIARAIEIVAGRGVGRPGGPDAEIENTPENAVRRARVGPNVKPQDQP